MVDPLPSMSGRSAGSEAERPDEPPTETGDRPSDPATRPTVDTPSETQQFLQYWLDPPRSSRRD